MEQAAGMLLAPLLQGELDTGLGQCNRSWVKSCCGCCCSFRFSLVYSARDSADSMASGLKPWSKQQEGCFRIAAGGAGFGGWVSATEAGFKAAVVAVAVLGLA